MEMSDYDKASIGEILAGLGDWYAAHLIRLIVKADGNNLRLLARVYPDEVKAVLEFMGDRRGEVYESLTYPSVEELAREQELPLERPDYVELASQVWRTEEELREFDETQT